MIEYSPFEKSIDELESGDLKILKEVSEGWYIDYKSSLISPDKIARAVSAFANTYGGWLFFGIKEISKEDTKAGEFIGIPDSEIIGAANRIQQAIATHIAPAPFYETKTIKGPDKDIGLGEEKNIVVVHVPRSENTPHVHSRGVIYRRVGDGADPTPETARQGLDELWARREKEDEEIGKWIARDLALDKAEQGICYLRLLISKDLWKTKKLPVFPEISWLEKIFSSTQVDEISSIGFEYVKPTAYGCIARHVASNVSTRLGLTWRLNRRFESEILIPINQNQFETTQAIEEHFSKYDLAPRFAGLLDGEVIENLCVLDLNHLFATLISVFNKQKRLCDQIGLDVRFDCWAELINLKRAVPFLSADWAIQDWETTKVPFCFDKKIILPGGEAREDFISIKDHQDQKYPVTSQALTIFVLVCEALGIKTIEYMNNEACSKFSLSGLVELANISQSDP